MLVGLSFDLSLFIINFTNNSKFRKIKVIMRNRGLSLSLLIFAPFVNLLLYQVIVPKHLFINLLSISNTVLYFRVIWALTIFTTTFLFNMFYTYSKLPILSWLYGSRGILQFLREIRYLKFTCFDCIHYHKPCCRTLTLWPWWATLICNISICVLE